MNRTKHETRKLFKAVTEFTEKSSRFRCLMSVIKKLPKEEKWERSTEKKTWISQKKRHTKQGQVFLLIHIIQSCVHVCAAANIASLFKKILYYWTLFFTFYLRNFLCSQLVRFTLHIGFEFEVEKKGRKKKLKKEEEGIANKKDLGWRNCEVYELEMMFRGNIS